MPLNVCAHWAQQLWTKNIQNIEENFPNNSEIRKKKRENVLENDVRNTTKNLVSDLEKCSLESTQKGYFE